MPRLDDSRPMPLDPPAGQAGPKHDLRQQAQARVEALDALVRDTRTPATAERLIHELRVYQVELELQNEELRRTQEDLEVSRARYFDLYDLAPVGYLTLSDAGLIQEANLAATDLLQAPRAALIGQPLTHFILPADQDTLYLCRQQLQSTGAPQACELRLRRTDGAPCWVHLQLSRAPAAPDGQPQWRSVLSDITARRQHEAERARDRLRLEELVATLATAKDAAETASRAKSAFLANMSHELRTPMNAIMGMNTLALRRATDPRQIDQLHKANHAARHLLALINDILDLSKIEADRLILATAAFNLDEVMADLTDLIGLNVADKALALVIDLPPDLAHRSLQGDAGRLGQILLNLVGNAIKFTARGSVTVRVQLVAEQADDLVLRFAVQDTGIGIAAADQPRLFTAFEQADSSTTRQYGGTGLGLAISRRLVELMGGTLGVDSRLGNGSTFWFTVRLAKTKGVDRPTLEPAPRAAEDQLRTRHARARLLVAEDEPVNREVFRELLGGAGLRVDVAANGAEALALAMRTDYDLILMDMQMPVLDGLDAAQHIRRLPGGARVPIIAVTANAFTEDRIRCLAAGMTDVITKPVDPQTLYATVLSYLPRCGDYADDVADGV